MEEDAVLPHSGQETTWWLLEPTRRRAPLEGTKRLGEAFRWGETWYQDRDPTQLKEI